MVVPLALSPLVPPGLGPVDLLTAAMAPFHVHPLPSYAMLVSHSRLALNRHIAVVVRSVTTLRHGRGHGPRLPLVANQGTKLRRVVKVSTRLMMICGNIALAGVTKEPLYLSAR